MRPRSLPSQRRPSRWLAALFVLALLYAQALGQAHRALHSPGTEAGVRHAHSHGAGHDVSGKASGPVQSGLFGHEANAEDCRLFDQHSLADLTPVAALLAAAPPPAVAASAPATAGPPGRPCRTYLARGPPSAAS